jgi:hypothetical protein
MARPNTGRTERFELRVDSAWLEVVDDLRRREKDLPTRAEYMRRLAIRENERLQSTAA